MSLGERKPKSRRPGFAWVYRETCRCSNCPWKGNCRGEITPHWIEVRQEEER